MPIEGTKEKITLKALLFAVSKRQPWIGVKQSRKLLTGKYGHVAKGLHGVNELRPRQRANNC